MQGEYATVIVLGPGGETEDVATVSSVDELVKFLFKVYMKYGGCVLVYGPDFDVDTGEDVEFELACGDRTVSYRGPPVWDVDKMDVEDILDMVEGAVIHGKG